MTIRLRWRIVERRISDRSDLLLRFRSGWSRPIVQVLGLLGGSHKNNIYTVIICYIKYSKIEPCIYLITIINFPKKQKLKNKDEINHIKLFIPVFLVLFYPSTINHVDLYACSSIYFVFMATVHRFEMKRLLGNRMKWCEWVG